VHFVFRFKFLIPSSVLSVATTATTATTAIKHFINNISVFFQSRFNIRNRFSSVNFRFDLFNSFFFEFWDFEDVSLFSCFDEVRFLVSINGKSVHKNVPGVILKQRSSGDCANFTLLGLSWAINEVQDFQGDFVHFGGDIGEFSCGKSGSNNFAHVSLIIEIGFNNVSSVIDKVIDSNDILKGLLPVVISFKGTVGVPLGGESFVLLFPVFHVVMGRLDHSETIKDSVIFDVLFKLEKQELFVTDSRL